MEQIRDLASAYERNVNAGDYLNYAIALGVAKGSRREAAELYAARWPNSRNLTRIKAAVDAGTTSGSGWEPLAPLKPLSSALIELLAGRTAFGQMQSAMRRVPFNVRVARQTAGMSVGWVGEGGVEPVGSLALDQVSLTHSKVAALCIVSEDLAKMSDPGAEAVIRSNITNAISRFLDIAFLNPSIAEVTDVSPGSITNGTTEIVSSGSTAAAIESDIAQLIAAIAAGSDLIAPFIVMSPATAIALAGLRTSGGQAVYPAVTARGGTLAGVPVAISTSMPTDSNSPSNAIIVALDASEVMVADAGIELNALRHASVQADSAPDDPTSASTVLLSLWQRNLVGILCQRYVRWARRRDGAVAYLTGLQI